MRRDEEDEEEKAMEKRMEWEEERGEGTDEKCGKPS